MSSSIHHGRTIRCIRLLQGMKQQIFARKMGISQQRVSKLEQQRRLTAETLKIAAKALNISVEVLEKFDERSLANPEAALDANSKGYYLRELAKRDKRIEELEMALDAIMAQSTKDKKLSK